MRFTTIFIAVAAMTAAASAAISPASGTVGAAGLVQPALQSGFFDARFDATGHSTTGGSVDLVGIAGHGGPTVLGGQFEYTKQSLGLLGQSTELASGQRGSAVVPPLTAIHGDMAGRSALRVDAGVRVVPVPVPGAVLLGAIGVAMAGWIQRRT